MTRDEILKLEAGREMDALILKHIFNADVIWKDSVINSVGFSPAGFHGKWPNSSHVYSKGGYSADISAAWEVVEKLKSIGLELLLDNYSPNWSCDFTETLEVTSEKEVSADTAPLAICRAALLATLED